MPPSIAIIGAGPCGLTLARLLEKKGFTDYVVYERGDGTPEDLSRSGGSLDLRKDTGQLALRECGLYSEFEKYARWHDQTFRVAGQDGVVCMDLGEVAAEAGAGAGNEKKGEAEEQEKEEDDDKGRDAPEIDRGALRQILLDSVPQEKIRWGCGLAEVVVGEGDATTHTLKFANGEVATGFKLIVGTDGAWSRVRAALTPIKPRYAGRHFLEVSIQKSSPIYDTVAAYAQSGMLAVLGARSKNMTIQRQGDLSYRVYLGLRTEENFASGAEKGGEIDLSNPQGCREVLLSDKYYGDWAEKLKDVIRHAETFRKWSLYYLPTEAMAWKSVRGLTVAGDAAHLTLPNGEGVNIAMIDAMDLVNQIAKHGGIENAEGAVRVYEKDMVARALPHIEDGLEMNEHLQHDENPKHFCDYVRAGLLH